MRLVPTRKGRRIAGLSAALALVIPLGWVAWNQAHFNFGVVRPGTIYRSGQMTRGALRRTFHDQGVRTVLNLRGPNPREAWYRDELAATLEAGATHVDIPMSSCIWISHAQLRTLVRVVETSERPLLIHCAWGSERTGLAAAIAELLRPGATLADATNQFSLRYLFVRLGDGKIMADFLDQYAGWLAAQRLEHRPEAFRRWVAEGYVPGKPNREQWPYDPSPLVVITRPPPASATAAGDRPDRAAVRR